MIHSTATVNPGALIGSGVEIGPYAYIEQDVQIGDGCVIGPHVSVLRYTSLGQGCRVHAGAVLGDLPQDLAFNLQESRVKIGEKCVIREHVTIHRGTKPETVTEIGDNCFLMACSHCAHNVKLGNGVILANSALLGGYVEVGDRVFISGNAVVHQFVKIGRLAMMGGLSGASKDIPPFCTVKSAVANRIVGLNVVGMRRAGFTSEQRLEVKRAFAILYRSGLNYRDAVTQIRQTCKGPLGEEFAAFVEQSKRGICSLSSSGESDDE